MKEFVQEQWNAFVKWINVHGGPTKVGAAAIIVAGLAYGSVPPFHDMCVAIWMAFPTKVKTVLVTAFTLYSWLRNPATRKLVDGILGPGDTIAVKDPVVSSDGTMTATSATVTKALTPDGNPATTEDDVAASTSLPGLVSPLIVPKKNGV